MPFCEKLSCLLTKDRVVATLHSYATNRAELQAVAGGPSSRQGRTAPRDMGIGCAGGTSQGHRGTRSPIVAEAGS